MQEWNTKTLKIKTRITVNRIRSITTIKKAKTMKMETKMKVYRLNNRFMKVNYNIWSKIY